MIQFLDETAAMQRALELARSGQGRVEPNPCVGAVIVDQELRLLGEGFHESYGGPHAEVHALRAAGAGARGATLFVTLEPCHHTGKTPPCTAAIIAAGIQRVVIAILDPARHGSGSTGQQQLRAAGIQVEVGLCAGQAEELLAPFSTLVIKKRPYLHAKWAMTLDGKIASACGDSKWISNAESRMQVHLLRGRMDGILTGIGTVLQDDPLLTARPDGPRQATRIVLDSRARLPMTSQLVQTAHRVPVLLVTTSQATASPAAVARCRQLEQAGVEIMVCDSPDGKEKCDIPALMQELFRRNFTNVMLEAGSEICGAFHDLQLIDEVHCFIAPKLVGGAAAPSPLAGQGMKQIPQHSSLIHPRIERFGDDLYLHGRTRPQTSDL